MSDTETEQQEIQERVQQIFAHNTLPISDTSEISDLDLSSHPANPNTYFESYPPSSGDSSYSETYQFAGEESPSREDGVLTPGEVGSRINSAAHKYRVYPSNSIQSLESGHVARRVEMFQDAQNVSRGGYSNSSRVDSPFESNVSQLKAKFDLAPSTSPLPRKFSHPVSWTEDHTTLSTDGHMPPPRANLETLYSTGMSAHNNSFQKFNYTSPSPSHLPRSILRRSKSVSPERSEYTTGKDICGYSHLTPDYPAVDSRSRSISPKPRPRTRTLDPNPHPAPRTGVEDLYARPDLSHKRKRTLSASSARSSPPKRPSLSCGSENASLHTSSAVFNTSAVSHNSTGTAYSSRKISMSPDLEISKQLMRTVRRSMSPEDLRQLEAQFAASGSEETPKETNSVPLTSPKAPPQNPAPYDRNRSFISAMKPGQKPGSRPVPNPASDSAATVDTSIGFPHRIPRRSETSFSLHTPKCSDEDHTLTMDESSRQVIKSLSSNLTACSSQTSINTLTTDISSVSSTVPTHCLTFSSGYNIYPAPSAPPRAENNVVTRSVARNSSDLKERLGSLHNQIYLLEDGWRQATSALYICHAHGGMGGSGEEVEAERLLLNCSLRREAFFHEVKLLENGYGNEPLTSCTATLTLSGIQLSLNQQFMEHLTTRAGIKFSYHFVCVIKSSHPSQVVATHPLSPQPSVLNPNYNQLAFSDTLVLHCVKEGFQLTPMIFLFEASRGKEEAAASQAKTPVGKVKRILNAAKSGSPLKRQKSLKKAKRKLPLVTSETEIVLKKSRFALIASTCLDKRHIKRTDFRLESHPSPVSPYPLIPLLRLSVSASPDLEREEVTKGFLTIFHDDLTWNRRWCVLAHTTLSFWLYPEEEEQVRPPAGTISLQFITGEIVSTNRIQCARMNTFCFTCGKTRSKKYLISADSKSEKEKWMTAIKQIRSNIQAWV